MPNNLAAEIGLWQMEQAAGVGCQCVVYLRKKIPLNSK